MQTMIYNAALVINLDNELATTVNRLESIRASNSMFLLECQGMLTGTTCPNLTRYECPTI
jgi:hypothetical protein